MEDFEAKDIHIVFLQDKIDRTTAMGSFFKIYIQGVDKYRSSF
ncbi:MULTISPECIES: hypothetical protein [unclassified Lysinibacillus]